MSKYLIDSSGKRTDFPASVQNATDEMSKTVLNLIVMDGMEWVEVRMDERPDLITRWTALDRTEFGVKIAVSEFDGDMYILDTGQG